MWNAIREKNFNVKTFRSSKDGKEKELNASMAFEIAECMFNLDPLERKHAVFIIATGDRDLKTAIERVLKNEIPVELWSWKEHTARDFKQLANTNNDLFKIKYLDDEQQERFSYTAVRSSTKRDINPTRAIVYRNVHKDGFYELADYINDLEHTFFITPVLLEQGGRQDLIVEFPNTNPEVMLRKLSRSKYFPYQPCSYPEYSANSKPISLLSLPLTNRFEALIDKNEDLLVDAASHLHLQDSLMHGEHDGDEAEDYSKWQLVFYKNPAIMEQVRKRRETECPWKDHCASASLCQYKHTEAEKKLFARHPNLDFTVLKTRECSKKAQHITDEQKKLCTFAHTNEDSWCLICKTYGHLTENCKAN